MDQFSTGVNHFKLNAAWQHIGTHVDKRLDGCVQGLRACAREAEGRDGALDPALRDVIADPSHAADNVGVAPSASRVQNLDGMQYGVLGHPMDGPHSDSGCMCPMAVIIPPNESHRQ